MTKTTTKCAISAPKNPPIIKGKTADTYHKLRVIDKKYSLFVFDSRTLYFETKLTYTNVYQCQYTQNMNFSSNITIRTSICKISKGRGMAMGVCVGVVD